MLVILKSVNMKLLIVLCAAIAVASSAAVPREIFTEWEGRIVGGSNAAQGQFPYQVSLRSAGNAHFCGGFIRNTRWTVSAAHCTIGRTIGNTVIVVGALNRVSGGVNHNSARIVNHPNYNANTLANDISVVQSATVFTFNANVASINIGTGNVGGGINAVVSGWGQTAHPGSAAATLQFLGVQTLTNADCQSRHSAANRPRIFANTICAFVGAGRGTCMGDSGGPLAIGNTAIGAVSWGIACAQGFPDVYARVSSHAAWINAQN